MHTVYTRQLSNLECWKPFTKAMAPLFKTYSVAGQEVCSPTMLEMYLLPWAGMPSFYSQVKFWNCMGSCNVKHVTERVYISEFSTIWHPGKNSSYIWMEKATIIALVFYRSWELFWRSLLKNFADACCSYMWQCRGSLFNWIKFPKLFSLQHWQAASVCIIRGNGSTTQCSQKFYASTF